LENARAFSHIPTARRLLHFGYSDSAHTQSFSIIIGLEKTEKTTTRPILRAERRSASPLQIGDVFTPFQLFIGAMIPSAVLRNPDLSPSAKLVFARLTQFAGRQGKAWPSDQTLGQEVGLGYRQARRCVAELERYGLIRRVSRVGHSNLFEFL
jgi:Helix-turn-helix domain